MQDNDMCCLKYRKMENLHTLFWLIKDTLLVPHVQMACDHHDLSNLIGSHSHLLANQEHGS
jgi:hypothetical protein